MAYTAFGVAIRAWLEADHGSENPLFEFWVRDHLTKVEAITAAHVPRLRPLLELHGARVLDVGCGTGGGSVAFSRAGARVVGLDRSGRMMELARLRVVEDQADVALVHGDAAALPFGDESFDLCLCDQVVEHVRDKRRLLREMHRVLREGGIALVAVPHKLALREVHSGLLGVSWLPHAVAEVAVKLSRRRRWRDPWDVWLPSPWHLRRMLIGCGFEEVSSAFTEWQPPAQPSSGLGVLRAWLERLPGLRAPVRAAYRILALLRNPSLYYVLRKPHGRCEAEAPPEMSVGRAEIRAVAGGRARVVALRIPHHGTHSGYDQLVRYLGSALPNGNARDGSPCRLPSRIVSRFVAHAGSCWYTPEAFCLEARVLALMARRGRRVYHFLYGEDSYRYAGVWRGLRGNALLSTFHQPPDVFERVVRAKGPVRRLSAVVALASNQASYFQSWLDRSQVFLIPHGVDTRYFHPAEQPERKPVCLFVGQWLRDFAILPEIVDRVVGQSGARFVVVTSEERRRDLAALPGADVRSGISENELRSLYQEASVLVLPLQDCVANNTILEAMACGLPVVASDVGGVRDYVSEGCGVLSPRGDAPTMARDVLQLLADGSTRRAMASAARERALRFDWQVVAGQMRNLYDQVASR